MYLETLSAPLKHVVQTIYAGGARRATYESDRVGADAALSDEFFTQYEVVYAADDAYWNLAAARDRLRITEQYVDIIRSLKRVVDARFENGYISRSDVLMTDTRLSEAEYGSVPPAPQLQVSPNAQCATYGYNRPPHDDTHRPKYDFAHAR